MKNKFKEGQIIETFNPFLFFVALIIAVFLMSYAVHSQQLLFGLGSLAFAWQSGWGMTIKRFHDSEKTNKRTHL